MNKKRYLINNDDDGHWYIMPEDQLEAFNNYVYEDGPEPPGLLRLSGHPNNVTFETPFEFGKPLFNGSWYIE